MSESFDKAFAAVIRVEQGEVTDQGGLTKYGISQRQYPNLNIRELTPDGSKQIYLTDYWNKLRCEELPAPLAMCVFDAAVNEGRGTAARLLQNAVKVKDDGIVGVGTIAAAHSLGHEGLIRFMAKRAVTYSHTQDYEIDGEGWHARLFRIFETAIKG